MVYCSKCGIKNEDDAVYCEKCGNQIERKVYPRNKLSIEKTCPSCGFINKENRDYCQKCQESLKEPGKERLSSQNSVIKNENGFKIIPLIWGIIGGFILIILNYSLFGATLGSIILIFDWISDFGLFFTFHLFYYSIPFIGGLIPCLLVSGRFETGIKYGLFSSAVLYILVFLIDIILLIIDYFSFSFIIYYLNSNIIYFIISFIIWILLGIGGGIIGLYIKKLLNKEVK